MVLVDEDIGGCPHSEKGGGHKGKNTDQFADFGKCLKKLGVCCVHILRSVGYNNISRMIIEYLREWSKLERSIKLTIQLTGDDKKILLTIARDCILREFHKEKKHPNFDDVPGRLHEYGATFVTLTKHGELRGCIGTLSAYQPLVQDVCEHAKAAAFHDYRFPPVKEGEMADIVVEISYLTDPLPLAYTDAEDLKQKLRRGVDGVTLSEGHHRATFLPQVWEQLPEVEDFLSHLCHKMGVQGGRWKAATLTVETYQAVHFSEEEFSDLA